MYVESTGNIRRVKKFKFDVESNKEKSRFDVVSKSLKQVTPYPVLSSGYHRGIDRAFGIFCKKMRQEGLLSDKQIIDALLDSGTIHRTKAAALILTWKNKEESK